MVGKQSIDLILVPSGLAIVFGYHVYFLYRILRRPETTVIGYDNHIKRAWVDRMIHATVDEASIAQSVMSSNISASSTMASLSMALSSLLGAWLGNGDSMSFVATVTYGDTSASTRSVKYISLLACLMLAFAMFVQSSRLYIQASFLLTMLDSDAPTGYVSTAVIRGGEFWVAGLRALYLAAVLLFWIFGPIPMFACSVCMVAALHVLDTNRFKLHTFRFGKSGKVSPVGALSSGVWIGSLS